MPRKRSLHAMLLTRLALVTAVISVFVALVVVFNERSRVFNVATDRALIVGSHHEKFEGNGYPAGLKGADIPVPARIFAIADVFDALTSRRPYKEPFGFDESIGILMQGRGSHFDPEILDVFMEIARPLFDVYGGKDDDRPRKDLSGILDRYHKADIATFFD